MTNAVRPTREDIMRASGSGYCYAYKALPLQANTAMIRSYCTHQREMFAPIAKVFDAEVNSRWILRHYLAIKFATAANMLAGSSLYASEHNLRLAVPYFNYYAVLNACRAFLMTSPLVIWAGGKTVEMTHQNIINRTADSMRALDPDRRVSWLLQLEGLREHRELFSYRFPLSGPSLAGPEAFDCDAAIALGRLIAELASLNSECFDASLRKHASMDLPVLELPEHEWASAYELAGTSMPDFDDLYRFDRYVRGWNTVSTLEVMTSDGLVDDIYGNWTDPDGGPGMFDPDHTHQVILAL